MICEDCPNFENKSCSIGYKTENCPLKDAKLSKID